MRSWLFPAGFFSGMIIMLVFWIHADWNSIPNYAVIPTLGIQYGNQVAPLSPLTSLTKNRHYRLCLTVSNNGPDTAATWRVNFNFTSDLKIDPYPTPQFQEPYPNQYYFPQLKQGRVETLCDWTLTPTKTVPGNTGIQDTSELYVTIIGDDYNEGSIAGFTEWEGTVN